MKNRSRNVCVLASVAALGFVAGRLLTPATSIAAPPPDEAQDAAALAEAMAKASTPGPQHQHLNALAGSWNVSIRFRMDPKTEWMESTGTVTRDWVLDKRFLKETVDATSPMPGGGTFQGLGYIGYNTLEGVYQSVWMENQSTAIMTESGAYDAANKVMRFRGAHRDPVTGRSILVRSELDMRDPNRHVYSGYSIALDGSEYKSFEGTATRR
jgi:hypothetical protein